MSNQLILRVHLFGGLHLERYGASVGLPATRSARLLLAYLLIHADRWHERAFLAGLLWPDAPEADARRRLRQALWRLRRVFPDLHSDRYRVSVALDEGMWVDVIAFQEAIRRGEEADTHLARIHAWQDAVASYGGMLLPGFYEDWVLLERERLHQSFLRALDELIQHYMREGRYEVALRLARRLVDEEPLNEEAHRNVMRLCALVGQRESALHQYDELCHILADELGATPDAETEKLMQLIRTQTIAPPPAQPPPLFLDADALPLVGREEAWRLARTQLEVLKRGRGGVFVVRGETGVGKSRFLAELAAQAQWLGVQTWSAQALQDAWAAPYALWRQAIEPHLTPLRIEQLALELDAALMAALAAIFPTLRAWHRDRSVTSPLSGVDARRQLHSALFRLIAQFARRAPLLILFDDIQWADEASLDALLALEASLTHKGALVVMGFRDDDPALRRRIESILDRMMTPPTGVQLQLLSPEATERLIQAALGIAHPIPRFRDRIYQVTQGHPLFILETLRALHQQGILYRNDQGLWSTPWDDVTVDYAELPLTERLQSLYEQRLGQLSPLAWEIMQVAALIAVPFNLQSLHRILDASSQGIDRSLQDVLSYRLLREENGQLRLMHEALRQAIVSMISDEEARAWHARIARTLEVQGDAEPSVLAQHFQAAGMEEEALHYHQLAARHAQATHAYDHVRKHLDAAIALAQRLNKPPSLSLPLLFQREETLDILGEKEAQAQDLERLEQLTENASHHRTQVWLRRARFLIGQARFQEAQDAANAALALARSLQLPRSELDALLAISLTCIYQARFDEALAMADAMFALLRQMPEPGLQAQVHRTLGDAWLSKGHHDRAQTELEAALAHYQATEDPVGQSQTLRLMAILATEQGDIPKARSLYQRAIALSERIGYLDGQSKAIHNLGNLENLEGRPYRALHYYQQALELFHSLQNPRAEIIARLNAASMRLDLFGSEEKTLQELTNILSRAKEIVDPISQGQAHSLLGKYYFYRGDFQRALHHISKGVDILQAHHQTWMVQQDLEAISMVFLDMGEPEHVLQTLARAETLQRELGMPAPDAMTMALRARAFELMGDRSQALQWAQQVSRKITPNTPQSHLVAHLCAQVFQAVGEVDLATTWRWQAWEWLQLLLAEMPSQERARSLEQSPFHRAIAEAVAQWRRRVTMRLPRADAPTGRPLNDDEWVEVTWTTSLPEDDRIPTKKARRRHRLQRLLREAQAQGAAPTIDHLAKALEVSRATIKRDLAALRAAGVRVRTRGSR